MMIIFWLVWFFSMLVVGIVIGKCGVDLYAWIVGDFKRWMNRIINKIRFRKFKKNKLTK